MQDFEGKVAVVTGAASGIGLATARAFAQAGMKVVLSDIEADALEDAELAFESAGHEVLAVRTDVSKLGDVENLATAAVDHFGAVHVLHNNAGVVLGGPVEELSVADWEWVLGVNLWGVIHGVKAFLPHIKAAGEGHVVNTASTAGLYAMPIIGPYNVSKFGVVALSETLHRELEAAGSQVGASVLCPGVVATQIAESQRNRSAESAQQHSSSPQEDGFLTASGQMTRDGMDPAKVADLVVDAIRSSRFWILTHPNWLDILDERVTGMREGRLNSGFGG
jgi:NAD(P)-dependent dehydrogenase (short-subunit alcohol dehydrogenase family)